MSNLFIGGCSDVSTTLLFLLKLSDEGRRHAESGGTHAAGVIGFFLIGHKALAEFRGRAVLSGSLTMKEQREGTPRRLIIQGSFRDSREFKHDSGFRLQ